LFGSNFVHQQTKNNNNKTTFIYGTKGLKQFLVHVISLMILSWCYI